MVVDYQKGKIYSIRNSINDTIYIGSTCQGLANRMSSHRADAKQENRKNIPLFKAMNELGLDNFYIELICNFPCQCKEELLKKEGETIREHLGNCYNRNIPGRTMQQWTEENKDILKSKIRMEKYCIQRCILKLSISLNN